MDENRAARGDVIGALPKTASGCDDAVGIDIGAIPQKGEGQVKQKSKQQQVFNLDFG